MSKEIEDLKKENEKLRLALTKISEGIWISENYGFAVDLDSGETVRLFKFIEDALK